jgi:hypothetical protein
MLDPTKGNGYSLDSNNTPGYLDILSDTIAEKSAFVKGASCIYVEIETEPGKSGLLQAALAL